MGKTIGKNGKIQHFVSANLLKLWPEIIYWGTVCVLKGVYKIQNLFGKIFGGPKGEFYPLNIGLSWGKDF